MYGASRSPRQTWRRRWRWAGIDVVRLVIEVRGNDTMITPQYSVTPSPPEDDAEDFIRAVNDALVHTTAASTGVAVWTWET